MILQNILSKPSISKFISVQHNSVINRVDYLDVLSGILIINMILVHIECMTGFPYSKFGRFLSFFMPWFFFKAGMFTRKQQISTCVKKSFNRLLAPFIVYSIIGELIYRFPLILNSQEFSLKLLGLISVNACKSVLLTGTVVGNLSLWYLTSLFAVKCIFTWCLNRNLLLLIIVICLVAPILYFTQIHLPIYVSNISSGLFFFSMGYLFKNIRIISTSLSAFVVTVWIAGVVYFPNEVDMKNNVLCCGNYLMWYITSLVGIIGFNSFTRLNNINIPILSRIGRDSMGYFGMHAFIITSLGFIFERYYSVTSITCVAITIVTMITILPIFIWLFRKSGLKILI